MKLIPNRLAHRLAQRKKLRRASGFHFAIAHRLRQLNLDDWRQVTAGQSFFFSPEYLQMLEATGPDNLAPRYALISDDDGPLAAVCMQVVEVGSDRLGAEGEHKLKVPLKQRILVAGNLLSYGQHAACFAPDADPAELWPAVAEALYRTRRGEKLGGQTNLVLVKDLLAADMPSSASLGKLSYAAVETEPNMVLTLADTIHNHADYLASLTSKYRSSIKQQVFKPFEAAGYAIERVDDVAAVTDRLHELYLQVHANAALRPFTLDAGYWPALAQAAGGKLAVHVAVKNGQIDGFIATLKDGDTAIAYHIGFEREVANQGVPLYLRLLHVAIAQSLDFGCRRISFGRTALEPKARLGCQPEPIQVWVRHRQPMLNQVIRPLLRFIQHEEAPEVSPFKRGGQEAA